MTGDHEENHGGGDQGGETVEQQLGTFLAVLDSLYDGKNATEITEALSGLRSKFQEAAHIDGLPRYDAWAGEPADTVAHPITGVTYHIYHTAHTGLVKVPVE